MSGYGKVVVWTLVFTAIAALLQSTLFARMAFVLRAVPDLTLGILVFTACANGVMTGQVAGFLSGFLLDFLSAAPLGLNAFLHTGIGALAGTLRGAFFIDRVSLPMLLFSMALCAAATVFKAILSGALNFFLSGAVPAYSLLSLVFWSELALNAASAPLVFFVLSRFSPLLVAAPGRRA
ncbi:MAG: Rod shape-determining protein MreD [Treponematales bacterium]